VGREKRIPGDLMKLATSLFEDLPQITFSNIYKGDRWILIDIRTIPDLPGRVAESIVVGVIAALTRLVIIAVMVSVYLRPSYQS
jgi:hypothetical protein